MGFDNKQVYACKFIVKKDRDNIYERKNIEDLIIFNKYNINENFKNIF